MYRRIRLKVDRFFVVNRPIVSAFSKVFSGLMVAVLGGIAGFQLRGDQESEMRRYADMAHAEEISRMQLVCHDNAEQTRDTLRQAAQSTSLAAEALKEMAAELGPESSRAARRAREAAKKAESAAQKAEEAELRASRILRPPPAQIYIMPDGTPQGEVPDWLDGP